MIRRKVNSKMVEMIPEEMLDRTTLGNSRVDEGNVEVELESEPVRWTKRDVKVDEAM